MIYLLWGHVITWIFITGYVFYLLKKSNDLEKELKDFDTE